MAESAKAIIGEKKEHDFEKYKMVGDRGERHCRLEDLKITKKLGN